MKIINGIRAESDLNIDNPDIDGGTIDDCVVGGITPASGTFTTLNVTGQLQGDLINNQMVQKTTFDILSLMADPRFLNLQCENPGAGTMTDVSGQGHDGTYQGSMAPGDRIKKGMGWALDLDGINDHINLGDHNDFSFGNSADDEAVTFFGVVEIVTGVSDRTIMSKYDLTTGSYLREYRITIDSCRIMRFVCVDESSNAMVYVSIDNAITSGYHSFVVTYDGAGGASAMNNVCIYIDGILIASTVSNNASYVAMENLITQFRIGALEGNDGNPADLFNGDISMVGVDGSEWSSFNVHKFHQLCKGLYGL